MSKLHGKFVWYELMTSDTAAAKTFYSGLLGWETQDADMGDMTYTLLSAGGVDVGGLMEVPADARAMGAGPSWIGYVAVDDVDAGAAQFKADGGAVYREAADIPGVGRFAIVADPQGAVLALFKGAGEAPAAAAPGNMKPGHVGWRELHAADREAAFGFYAKQFGWAKGEAVEMGPLGVYQLYAWQGETLGGMMNNEPGAPAPWWLYYFAVENIDASLERVKATGGQVLHGPDEVPGGAWIVQALDPQGAMFALVGQRG